MWSYYRRHPSDRDRSTWGQYLTLLRYWEAFHNGRGPDVDKITPLMLTAFFEATTQWSKRATWKRNADYMFKTLKAVCPQSRQNMAGLERGAILTLDTLPAWRVPTKRTFAERPSTQRGGHKPTTRRNLTPDDIAGLLDACQSCEFMDPDWWRGLIGFDYVYGFRIRNLLALTWEAVDLSERLLITRESKCGNPVRVPLHANLIDVLRRLFDRQTQRIFELSTGRGNLTRRFYPQWYAIFERAGLPRWTPHQFRAVASTTWDTYQPGTNWRQRILAHASNDIDEEHYTLIPAEWFDIVDGYPLPEIV